MKPCPHCGEPNALLSRVADYLDVALAGVLTRLTQIEESLTEIEFHVAPRAVRPNPVHSATTKSKRDSLPAKPKSRVRHKAEVKT